MKTQKTSKWSFLLTLSLVFVAALTSANPSTDKLDDNYRALEDSVYMVVDQMPEFQGGRRGLATYVNKHLRYPTEARRLNIRGKVYVRFVVDPKGQVHKVELIRKGNPVLDTEALRMVKSMPQWKAGMHKGNAVNVSLIVTVSFPPMR